MNFSKLFSILISLLSFFFLMYVYYKSEIIYDGNRIDYYKIYYLIGIILLVISLLSFYIKENLKIIISIISISVMLGLYSYEAVLQLGLLNESRQEIRSNLAKKLDIKYDDRSRKELYEELKSIYSENVTLTMHPSQFINNSYQLFPLSGISNIKTIHCNENGYYSIYSSDRYGFNNPDQEWNKNYVEYLAIGDSFVHGSCVNEINTISGIIRKKINNKGIINLGYKGIGPVIQNAILREYGEDIKYKNIIWFYSGNDIQDVESELSNDILSKYFNNQKFTQNLIQKQEIIDTQLKAYLNKELLNNNKLVNFIKLSNIRKLIYWKDKVEATKSQSKFNLRNFEISMRNSKKISERNNANFYFVYCPWINRYDSKTSYLDDDQIYYEDVMKIIEKLEIPIIDLHKEYFSKIDNPKAKFPFGIWGHYTPEAYEEISVLVLERIKKFEANEK